MGGGGGFMGWVIRDPRIIRWGGRGGFLDPRGSVIRGPPTTLHEALLKVLSRSQFSGVQIGKAYIGSLAKRANESAQPSSSSPSAPTFVTDEYTFSATPPSPVVVLVLAQETIVVRAQAQAHAHAQAQTQARHRHKHTYVHRHRLCCVIEKHPHA